MVGPDRMHKLNRGVSPACLAAYHYGVDQWCHTKPTYVERQDIWNCLDAMQAGRCAYCEVELEADDKHIEHFRQRSRHPAGTFDWTNLFGSCNRLESCGKHKDSCGLYQHGDLIKPDVEDPDDFLVFVSDGTISIKAGLQAAARRRAEDTLRIFNLDAKHGALRHMRRMAAAGYLQTAEEFRQYALEFEETDWRPLFEEELAAIEPLPFATTIRHALLGN